MISLRQIGKRFGRNWIFKGINYTFEEPGLYGILGANGSGKSTLLRIIGGLQNPSAGTCQYHFNGAALQAEKVFTQLTYCAPGMELIEEMTLKELLQFHFVFKPVLKGFSVDKIIKFLEFEKVAHRPVHDFSSGMKQRVKLAQAFFSELPVLLLDEPCSNLDNAGIQLYHQMLTDFCKNKLVLIASNDEKEYADAKNCLTVSDFHPA